MNRATEVAVGVVVILVLWLGIVAWMSIGLVAS